MRPALLGFTVGGLLIVLIHYGVRALQSPRHGRWSSCVLLAVVAAGFGAAVFVVEGHPFLRLTSAAFSGLLTYVFLGTAFQWKPFRPLPRSEDEGDDEEEDYEGEAGETQ